ncbi:MAG: Dam family site-specific DNA-(adenine-N6)-methyltransferase [Bacteroidales bacterium]|nr:Dam family site-specific DNA-(adenine-N6)-methyltransferase [Bacteroidales bacterium]
MNLTATKRKTKYFKSPLNYIGGKYKILNQILPLFPKKINQFVDLFAGGGNVGINIQANKVFFNDNLTYLIEMYAEFKKLGFQETLIYIENQIKKYELSQTNESGYLKFRDNYNQNRNPLDLFVLIAYSFNHQIRFNNSHEYNNPFGRNRSSFNETMKFNLYQFITQLNKIETEFSTKCFSEFDFSILNGDDFVYADPPYLITTGTYNDGKRGFKGWSVNEEKLLLKKLDLLNEQNIKFGLSNVIEHKGQQNEILQNWLNKHNDYKINFININYANSNYQTKNRDKNGSVEVLITNYEPPKPKIQEQTLF